MNWLPVQMKLKKMFSIWQGQVASILVVSLLCTWLWYGNYYPSSERQTESFAVKNSSSVRVINSFEEALNSIIPVYSIASRIQPVQPSSRNIVINYGDEDETSLKNMVLMDKVIVLPSVHARHPAGLISPASPLSGIGTLAGKNIFVPKAEKAKKNDTLFTIQLLASKRLHELQKFMSVYPGVNRFKIGLTKHKGTDWYILTMGEFKKRELAEQAIATLPAGISRFKPWVRSAKEFKVIG